ncbi:MAG: hypothetical protein JWR16_967 [Nevskia sp.]|nr:hypothetical protein [Nevskia sp.]
MSAMEPETRVLSQTRTRIASSSSNLEAGLARSSVDAAAERYRALSRAIAGRPLPLALLDLDVLDRNAQDLLKRAGGLPIRLGTKSIRCVEVLRRMLALSPRFQGLLCYSAREAAWLASLGFDDLLVAYPTVDAADLDAVAAQLQRGKRIVLMVDDPVQISLIEARARALGVCFLLSIDVDMSSRFPGIYFGMRRSPLTAPAAVVGLAKLIAQTPQTLKLVGLMGYEGQIAGLQDAVPGQGLKNAMLRMLKRRSVRELSARRQAAVQALREAGFALEFVNGGGTGSLESTAADPSVTEIAAGSGLYSPGLFDHFEQFHNPPALCFALQVVRQPTPDIVTCGGGGYIASGPAGADRLPRPYLPAGMQLIAQEGAGEVQTPVVLPAGVQIKIGEPLFFRHAKAGELAERFEQLLLLQGGEIAGAAATYRGQHQCFL